ncbi:helix-turn-helix transcriptional regulator [Sphingobacterium corticis]|uniref:Helix-turn-helix transcriptional regulator n=1 Tax=Sphingobacterium corticis TaxID=1812823 RepID=A0ABW5NJ62_9SPHI
MDIKKRFDRILSIFLHLQTKKEVTASQLAEKHKVSVRTIYRDIQALITAGVPINGEAGSGYSMLIDYKLPAMPFTREEALSFLAAEKLVNRYTDRYLSENFQSALIKMKALLRFSEKQHLEDANPLLMIQNQTNSFNEKLPQGLSILLESIVSKSCVHIHYLKPTTTEVDRRVIEPIGAFVEGRFWYVMAFCQLRQDYRQFRLDRIQHIQLASNSFSRTHQDLAFYLKQKDEVPKTRVVIRVDGHIAHYLHWDRHQYGFVEERKVGDEVEMLFDCVNVEEAFARWFMMFGDNARIMQPSKLKYAVKRILRNSLDRLD